MSNANSHTDRWALGIGINKYPKLARHYQLKGCVNDVELMADILQNNFGFPRDHITLLRNEEATHDGILAAMGALADRAGQDDVVVVHYSGHGSQRTALYPEYEPDERDETIVPYDSGRNPHPNRDITDNEIYAWLLRLKDITPYVTLIFDCCHSGSISRDAFGVNARWLEPDLRPLEEMQAAESRADHGIAERAGRDLGSSGWLPLGERYVLIAGCRDEESSYEHWVQQEGKGVIQGALTYFLSRELVKAESGTTYRDIFERASAQVTAAHSRQHPQMEGARDRELFGVREIEPLRFVPVQKRTGNRVTLAAGAAHGMTVSSQWAIYPQGTKRATDETPRLGLVEIRAVRAVTSDAEILEERDADAIALNCRAVEEAHFYGEMRLVVDIQALAGYDEAVAELEGLIENSDLLRRADPREPAQARVYTIPPRQKADDGDPVPQLGRLAEATWAVVDKSGRLMMPTHPVAEIRAVYDLRDNLEKRARYQEALALENPNKDSPLKGKVEMILLRQTPDEIWIEAEPEDRSGSIIYEERQRIAFKIVNNYRAPIYVSVLDFGLEGGIGLLHPIEGASEQLVPGGSIEVGIREGDELELYLPDSFSEILDPKDGEPRGGTETFKLFATTHEADFSHLTQEGYRDIAKRKAAKGFDTRLGQLLDMALTGYGNRNVRRNRLPPDEEWTTVARSFTLQARL